jgi:hypothetical protein
MMGDKQSQEHPADGFSSLTLPEDGLLLFNLFPVKGLAGPDP